MMPFMQFPLLCLLRSFHLAHRLVAICICVSVFFLQQQQQQQQNIVVVYKRFVSHCVPIDSLTESVYNGELCDDRDHAYVLNVHSPSKQVTFAKM